MRPIDGDKLYAVLDNIANHLFEMKSEPQSSMGQTIQYVMGIVMDQPSIIPPPNDPLTLEDLREMAGEPVWAMLRIPTNGVKCGWALVDTRHGYATAQQRWTNWTLWYDEYGKTWLAYRRKPEEGENAFN